MKKDIEITIDEMEAANHLHKTHGWALKEENVYNQEKDSVFFLFTSIDFTEFVNLPIWITFCFVAFKASLESRISFNAGTRLCLEMMSWFFSFQ